MKKQIGTLMATAWILCGFAATPQPTPSPFEAQKAAVQALALKDFAPVSIFKIPITKVQRAKFAVIDAHSHDYAQTDDQIRAWVDILDSVGIEKVNLMHCSWIGDPFEKVVEKYAAYKDHFNIWCCFDYTDFNTPDWINRAIARLETCHRLGAVGVGELVDKGVGDVYARPGSGEGIHMDNPRLKPLIERCGELGMPISIHIAEPIWMYEALDASNDGLMNGADWAVDTSAPNCQNYNQLMETFERTLIAYPKTTFIACHYLNMNQDLTRLGQLLDRHPNLYLDLAGRMGESAVTPRATRNFLIKYADRVLYGTDNGMAATMYRMTFRLLESADEHIYNPDYGYHWSYSGFELPDAVLKKIYHDNAVRLLGK
ncbi:MAG: amidohydrolase family protein [Alistipes sp.]